MLISPAHIGALGARPAGVAPAQASISIAPHDPPTFSSLPATWSPTVTVTNLAQVKWVVFQVSTANPPVWTATGSFTTVAIPGGNGSFTPSAQMLGIRDRLVVRSMDDSIEDVSGPATLNVPPPSETAGLIAAQLFVFDLTLGLNIDRNAIIQAGLITTAQLQEYKDQGITHVRFFPYIGGNAGHNYPNVVGGDLDWLFTAAERAMGVGLKVLMNLMEIVDAGQMADNRVMPYLSACATRIAGRGWDVTKYALGAANEYAGGTNTEHRAKMHEGVATLRAQLPNALLLCASAGWNAPDVLTDGTFMPPPDDRILVEWHWYDTGARNISAAQHWQGVVSAWAAQNNRITIASEWGLNNPESGYDTVDYPEVIDAAARGMGQQRPTFWAITDGGAFRFNQGSGVDSAALKAEFATAIGAGDDHIRAQAWFQPGGGVQVTRLQVLHRGTGNAIVAMQYGADTALRDTLASLTQLPVDLISRINASADNTVHAGTASFFDNGQPFDNCWLNASGNYTTSPAGWSNRAPMTQTLAAVTGYVSSSAAVPLFDFQVHWEPDLSVSDGNARVAYRNGHWDIVQRIRAARAKEVGKHVAFYGYCPYQGGSWAALSDINDAWVADVADATRTVFMACGNMMDGEPNTQFNANGDLSQWGVGGAPRIYPRVAFRMAKHAWDQGWCPLNVDLSDCPAMGPRILSAVRSGNSLDIIIAHDRGTAMTAGIDGTDWASFTFSDNAGTSHVAAISGSVTGPNTIQVTFPSTPPVGGRVWHCFHPFFRRRQLLRDNWHSVRPSKYASVPNVGVVEFPLQRTMAGVSYS